LGFIVDVTSSGRREANALLAHAAAPFRVQGEREPCRGDLLHESPARRPVRRHGAIGVPKAAVDRRDAKE
jgi:hypothetical protein